MNAVTIDSNRYRAAEMYAKLHNISIRDVVAKSLDLLFGQTSVKNSVSKESDFDKAMALMDTMMIKGGKKIPTDEKGIYALIEQKYSL